MSDHEPAPCGHPSMVAGCGGCDPSAIEYVILDGETALRKFDPARDMTKAGDDA